MLLSTKQKILHPAFFIVAAVFFSFLVSPGYQSFVSDQTIFIPLVYRALDPALFPNDLSWFEVMHTKRTLMTDFILLFVRGGIDIFWVLFLLAVVSRLVLLASLYAVIRFFTERQRVALFILLFFVTPFFIPGTGHTTVENTFNYRTVAIATSFLFLALYLYGKRLLSLTPLLFGFTIHPITTMPFFMFYYVHTALNFYKKREYRPVLFALTPILFVAAFLIYRNIDMGGGFFLLMDTEWRNLAQGRNDPAFFVFWDTHSFISLLSWIILLVIAFLKIQEFVPDKNKRVVILILLAVPTISLFIAALGEYFMLYGIIQLNFQRGLLLLSFFVPALFGIYSLWHAKQHPHVFIKNWLLFSVILWFLFKPDFVFMREQFVFFIPSITILLLGEKNRRLTITALGASLAVAAVGAFAYNDTISLVAMFLLLAGGFIIALAYKYAGSGAEELYKKALLLAPPLLIAVSLFYLSRFTIYPYFYYNTQYREACDWVQNNTDKDDVFIVEPFAFNGDEPSEFRLACFRPVFTTFEDGSPPYEPRDVSFEWKHRQTLAHSIKDDWGVLENIKSEYRVDYLFSDSALDIPAQHTLAYSNERFFIYQLR